MQFKNKIILFILLIMLSLITWKIIPQKEIVLDDVKLDIVKNDGLAIYVEENGEYVESKDFVNKSFYKYNGEKSNCIGIDGNIIEGILKYDEKESKVVVDTTESISCYLYFDKDYSIVRDLSGNGNNGVLNNIVSWNEEGITTSDEKQFGYVDCGLVNYDFNQQISLIVRFRLNKFVERLAYPRIIGNLSRENGIDTGVTLAFTGNTLFPHFSFWNSGTNSWQHLQGEKIEIGEFNTLVGTFDGEKEHLYLNGVEVSRDAKNTKINQSNVSFKIGRGGNIGNEDYSLITVTDALIYHRALPKEEIESNYINEIDENKVNKTSLLLYYKFK